MELNESDEHWRSLYPRREEFAEISPAQFLERLRRDSDETRAYFEEHPERKQRPGEQLDILLHTTAGNDARDIRWSLNQTGAASKGYLGLIHCGNGFAFAAAISEPALRSYIFHLLAHLGFGVPPERDEIADCIIGSYREQGGAVPCDWTPKQLEEWWTFDWP